MRSRVSATGASFNGALTDEPDADRRFTPGTLIGDRYRITGALGRGGMGAVYEATGLRLARRFAIKVPLAGQALAADRLRRFEREVAIGARLESSHIARVVDWDTLDDGTPFVVMEYVPGQSLRQVLEETPQLAVRRAVSLVLQACRGLAVAHAEGVVHRDLKPSNLAVTPGLLGSEHCTILDFGVAKLGDPRAEASESTRTGAIVGTLAYMPPEQIRGDKSVDGRADVYALGAILYECLSGRRAFEADSSHALMYRILHDRPTPLAELRAALPLGLTRLVDRALAADRDDRFDGVEELAAALDDVLASASVQPALADERTALDTTRSDVVERPRSRAGRLTGVGVVAAAAVAFLVGRALPWTAEAPAAATTKPEPASAAAFVAGPASPASETPARPPILDAAAARHSTAGATAKPAPPVSVAKASRPPAFVPRREARHATPEGPGRPSTSPGPAAPADPLTQRGYVLDSPYGAHDSAAAPAAAVESR